MTHVATYSLLPVGRALFFIVEHWDELTRMFPDFAEIVCSECREEHRLDCKKSIADVAKIFATEKLA